MMVVSRSIMHSRFAAGASALALVTSLGFAVAAQQKPAATATKVTVYKSPT
jgi:hypothetical protein